MSLISNIRLAQEVKRTNKNFLLNTGYGIHRSLSTYITWFLLKIFPSIKPNTVSATMIVISLFGAYLVYLGGAVAVIFGFVLMYLGFLLDKTDGDIARIKKVFSLKGLYLDEIFHIIFPTFLLYSVFYGYISEGVLYLSIILVLVIRYNRKVVLAIYAKTKDDLDKFALGQFDNDLIDKIINFFPIKIASLVERQDLLLIATFILSLLYLFGLGEFHNYFIGVYVVLQGVYFFRWTYNNLSGRLDEEVKRLKENGY